MADWVFIRGLVREAAHWGDFPIAFRAAFSQGRIHFADLPGNGIHHKSRTPLTVAEMTRLMRAEIHAAGLSRPIVMGLSLGGMVACHWAQMHPEELSGAIFVNTSFGGYSPMRHRFRVQAVPMTLRSVRERDAIHRERQQLSIASNRPELFDIVAPRWAGIARARPVSPQNAIRQLWAAARFRPPRRAPSVPQLILVGLGDRLVDPACSKAIASAWGARLSAHPTAGHDLSLDAGPWMISEISAWLAGLPAS